MHPVALPSLQAQVHKTAEAFETGSFNSETTPTNPSDLDQGMFHRWIWKGCLCVCRCCERWKPHWYSRLGLLLYQLLRSLAAVISLSSSAEPWMQTLMIPMGAGRMRLERTGEGGRTQSPGPGLGQDREKRARVITGRLADWGAEGNSESLASPPFLINVIS